MEPETDAFCLSTIRRVIDYIEENLTGEITLSDIAAQFYISSSFLSLIFKTVSGMTIMEYIRNRRLTLAGQELSASNIRIIDLAYKYGYETPEAFTKAFTRFHGFPPSFVRRSFPVTKVFKPIQIKVSLQGGWDDAITLTNADGSEQDRSLLFCYDDATNNKG